jgi:hypothetical protein
MDDLEKTAVSHHQTNTTTISVAMPAISHLSAITGHFAHFYGRMSQ